MTQKIYKRIGLRRDNNLGDLSNPTVALNNLLDNLIDVQGTSFISEDLNAIRTLSSYGITNDQYRVFSGSAERFTDSNGLELFVQPNITYQNRLDRFRLVSGEPRLFGGSGLTAKYYNPTEVNQFSQNIFTGDPFKIDDFWENGEFAYTQKITPESVNSNGGVEWEGYFVPTQTGSHTFRLSSSGCFTFDFETQGYTSGINTYTEINRIGITSTLTASGTSGTNSITLSTVDEVKYVAIGQSVSASFIQSGAEVSDINRSTGVIDLTVESGNAVTSSTSGNVTFFKTVGQDTYANYNTYTLQKFERYHIRIRYFIPENVDAQTAIRTMDVNHNPPVGGDLDDINFKYLYPLDYDFSESAKGSFNLFLDNSILSGGGTIGGSASSNDYVSLTSSRKVDIKYEPKSSLAEITRATVNGTTINGSNVIRITDTTSIEVGTYVFGSGISDGTRVQEILINEFIIIDQNATASATVSLTFIDHRGFVKKGVGSISGTTLTLSSGNTTDLRSGMIVIASGGTQYTGITTTGSTNTVTVSPSQTVSSTNVYFYQSRGLANNSLDLFCLPSATRCLIVSSDTSAGSSTIPVNSTTGISNGWNVYGFQFASGTTVSSFTANSVTISTPTTRNLVADSNFTVSSSSDEEKGLCCPPTDTSPPFNPTIDGLETVSGAENLRIDSGDIILDTLIVNTDVADITNYVSGDTSGSRLEIETPSGTFRILCV